MNLFVPGRVCLLGEHSDWAGEYRRLDPEIEKGYALIAGTDQGIHAEVGEHRDALVLTSVCDPATCDGRATGDEAAARADHATGDDRATGNDPARGTGAARGREPRIIPMRAEALRSEAERGGFWSYVAGVAARVLQLHRVGGLVLDNYAADLPVRKGLSSSAAICVLTARAFNRIYGLGLSTREEMELAYQGELATPSRCGRMDQGCAFGRRPVLMEFDGERLDVTEAAPGCDLYLLLVDLRARKDTQRILSRLHEAFARPGGPIGRGLRELLGPVNHRLVHAAVRALRAGDPTTLGALMREAQEQFDRLAAPACPEELTAPLLHRVLAWPSLQPHLWGGKGVGSQGDGAAQLLARSAADRDAAAERIERDLGLWCLRLTLTGAGAEST